VIIVTAGSIKRLLLTKDNLFLSNFTENLLMDLWTDLGLEVVDEFLDFFTAVCGAVVRHSSDGQGVEPHRLCIVNPKPSAQGHADCIIHKRCLAERLDSAYHITC